MAAIEAGYYHAVDDDGEAWRVDIDADLAAAAVANTVCYEEAPEVRATAFGPCEIRSGGKRGAGKRGGGKRGGRLMPSD